MIDANKWVCEECDWKGTGKEFLKAVNPFDPKDDISGCPKCKSVETLRPACDEPGCWDETSCGTPTKEGYRRTCYEHRPKEETQGEMT